MSFSVAFQLDFNPIYTDIAYNTHLYAHNGGEDYRGFFRCISPNIMYAHIYTDRAKICSHYYEIYDSECSWD